MFPWLTAGIAQNKEKKYNYNNRLIRLVCIVVLFLLKNKVIPVEEIKKINAEEFFEANSKYKEATEILKKIRAVK